MTDPANLGPADVQVVFRMVSRDGGVSIEKDDSVLLATCTRYAVAEKRPPNAPLGRFSLSVKVSLAAHES